MEIKRAEDALGAGQTELALGHLKHALELLPSSPRAAEIHLLTGRAHEQTGAGQKAIAAFEKAVALEPGNPAGHYLLALSYKAAKDFPRAHEAILKAVTLAPMNISYRFDRVTIELELGRKAEAERSFTEYEKRRDELIAQLKEGAGADPGGGPAGASPPKRDHRKRLLALAALAAVPSDERILQALASVLGDPSPEIRTAAAQALGDSATSDPKIRQTLVERVDQEKDASVRKVLRDSLARLPQPAPGPQSSDGQPPRPPTSR
jgi:tetratricopeptide (TPR) repeat protein